MQGVGNPTPKQAPDNFHMTMIMSQIGEDLLVFMDPRYLPQNEAWAFKVWHTTKSSLVLEF